MEPKAKPNMLEDKCPLATSLNAKIQGLGTETIVFAHGYGTDQSIWDKITPFFTENYRVVLFDWPFSGAVKDESLYDPLKYSSLEAFADDLVALLDQMDLKDVTFVGHSMSGMIGCLASIKRPQLFKRLILLGASPRYYISLLFLSFSSFESLCLLLVIVIQNVLKIKPSVQPIKS